MRLMVERADTETRAGWVRPAHPLGHNPGGRLFKPSEDLPSNATRLSKLSSGNGTGRTAPGVCADRSQLRRGAHSGRTLRLRHKKRRRRGRRSQRMHGPHRSGKRRRKPLAVRRRCECRPGPAELPRHPFRHCAMVLPMPPAASRQTQLAGGLNSPRERTEPEQHQQKNGNSAPHL
jgi:hypothetical protein